MLCSLQKERGRRKSHPFIHISFLKELKKHICPLACPPAPAPCHRYVPGRSSRSLWLLAPSPPPTPAPTSTSPALPSHVTCSFQVCIEKAQLSLANSCQKGDPSLCIEPNRNQLSRQALLRTLLIFLQQFSGLFFLLFVLMNKHYHRPRQCPVSGERVLFPRASAFPS